MKRALVVLAACGGGGDSSFVGDAFEPARCIRQIEVGEKPCVVRRDHTVWCGSPLARVEKWTDVEEITPDAICARKRDGTVWCDFGTPIPDEMAAPAPIFTDAIAFAGAFSAYCAIKSDHTLWCWGSSSAYPVLPPGAGMTTPAQHTSLGTRVAQIAMRTYDHVCARTMDGTIYCWGENQYGQVGNGTTTTAPTPTAIGGVPMPIDVDVDSQQSCAVGGDGSAWCWGTNYKGGIGDGTMIDRHVPARVIGLPSLVPPRKVQPGYGATFALLTDGTVWAWGSSLDGQLGDGSTIDRPSPGPVPAIANALDVRSTNRLACAHDGTTVSCWGRTMTPTPTPLALSCE